MRGTWCINIDENNKSGSVPSKIGKRFDEFPLGSPEGVEALKNPKINSYAVVMAGEEFTYCRIYRRKDNVWVASPREDYALPRTRFVLGRSEAVTYSSLLKAYAFFSKKVSKAIGQKKRRPKRSN